MRRRLIWEQLEPRLALAFTEFIDPHPAAGNQFGTIVLPLKTGNVVITSPKDDRGGTDAGAVYLFNGSNGNLISTLYGSTTDDRLGGDGVYEVGNGNFVVRSLLWDNGPLKDVGAVTWGSGQLGVNGAVSSQNSLIGTSAGDQVGFDGIEVLSNGNYVVRSSSKWDSSTASDAGAITWASGNTGISGTIKSTNSLIGSRGGDKVGSAGIVQLTNGNYVVKSPLWDNGTITDAGAVTWGNGTTGVSGSITALNSLVGSHANDKLGSDAVVPLINGNFVVNSPDWDNGSLVNAGAVTWGNGVSGLSGTISATNSYIGGQNFGAVGSKGVVALANGNYVFISGFSGGSVTWGNGTTGSSGIVSASNSLLNAPAFDSIFQYGKIIPLANGHYLVKTLASVTWRNGTIASTGVINEFNSLLSVGGDIDLASGGIVELPSGDYVVVSPGTKVGAVSSAGAVTWGSGTSGIRGYVSETNSLVGAQIGDAIGSGGVFVLANGNYVVASPEWSNGGVRSVGAVTLGNGTTGTTGVVDGTNSLIGGTAFDGVGSSGVLALTNGNYVVASPRWSNGTAESAGAVTFANGLTGVTGFVNVLNSLVGDRSFQSVGSDGVTALANGNYVVSSKRWAASPLLPVGSVTWGSGISGVAGPVSSQNSLVSNSQGGVGVNGVKALANGNYIVINSYAWGGITGSGAVTWVNGTQGLSGFVTAENSLVGSSGDQIGATQTVALKNGNYLVSSQNWNGNCGAVTLGNGMSGTFGLVSTTNSVVGLKPFSNLRPIVLDDVNESFYAIFLDEDGGKVRVGSQIQPSVSIAATNAREFEGNTFTTNFTFTITRLGSLNVDSTISYFVSGTGTHPADFSDFGDQLPSGTFILSAGERTRTLTISVRADTAPEEDEEFTVTLSQATNGLQLGNNRALATILDDDLPLAGLLVTNANDDGAGSLREAVRRANVDPDRNSVFFNIPGAGTHTIHLQSALPDVLFPLAIDGTTQPGFAGSPLIELNGLSAGAETSGVTIIGGDSLVKGLMINGFGRDAIGLYLAGNNVLEGNYLGVDAVGKQARANQRGVGIYDSANNRVGGSSTAQRNLISGNRAHGIYISKPASTGNQVQGNFIGTDLTGSTSLPNGGSGVFIDTGAHQNTIGTNADGTGDTSERNVISGNDNQGVQVSGIDSNDNIIAGNFMGIAADGVSPLGNKAGGVLIDGGAKRNRIGGGPSSANLIGDNLGVGIAIVGTETIENAIRGNAIFDNAGLGIDLDADGVTTNDASDDDTGANTLQNYPTILSAFNYPDGLKLELQLSSLPSSMVDVEFFVNDVDDPSHHGEGKRLLGVANVQMDSTGNATFNFSTTEAVANGKYVTATATDARGNTSEFSSSVQIARAELELTLSTNQTTEKAGTLTGTIKRHAPTNVDLAVLILSSTPSAATVPTTVTIPAGESSVTFPVSIVDDLVADGDQVTSITASASGLYADNESLTVLDDEVAALSLTLSTSRISENNGVATGTVTRNTPIDSAIAIVLHISDPTAAQIPTIVTIPAGVTSATFVVTAVDDTLADGDQVALLTASAIGFVSATTQITVTNDDTRPHFWQNDVSPLDVNLDGKVTAIDALFVINFLNAGRSGRLPDANNGELAPPPFIDVNGDDSLSAIDALLVINALNRQ